MKSRTIQVPQQEIQGWDVDYWGGDRCRVECSLLYVSRSKGITYGALIEFFLCAQVVLG